MLPDVARTSCVVPLTLWWSRIILSSSAAMPVYSAAGSTAGLGPPTPPFATLVAGLLLSFAAGGAARETAPFCAGAGTGMALGRRTREEESWSTPGFR